MPLLSVKDVRKTYDNGRTVALSGVTMALEKGAALAIMGPSGSGKSTLLNLLGTLDRPTDGEIRFGGKDLFSHIPLHRFRSRNIGFVFQFHHLIPSLTLLENVELALVPWGISAARRRARAQSALEQMNLTSRQSSLPPQTSGGERQRAAIARALVHQPKLVLADEPTGHLDTKNGEMVMNLLMTNCRENGTTVVVATHDPEIAALADRQLYMRNGRIISKEKTKEA